MPNDAKLGLLVGVMGVIVVAVMSANRLPHPQTAANVPGSHQKNAPPPHAEKAVVNLAADIKPTPMPDVRPVPAVLPQDLPSTPVVRTKRDQVATPTSRTRDDDDLEP